MFSMISRLMRL